MYRKVTISYPKYSPDLILFLANFSDFPDLDVTLRKTPARNLQDVVQLLGYYVGRTQKHVDVPDHHSTESEEKAHCF